MKNSSSGISGGVGVGTVSRVLNSTGYVSDETYWEWSKRLDNGLMVFLAHPGENDETMGYELYFHPFVKVDKKLGGLYKQRSVADPITYNSSDAIDFGVGLFKLDTPSYIDDVEKKLVAAEEKSRNMTPAYNRKEVGPVDRVLGKGDLSRPTKDLYKDPSDYKGSFLTKEEVVRQIIKEEIQHMIQEANSKVLGPELGGSDDSNFLKVVWYMDTNQLEELLKTSINDLGWLKKHSNGLLNTFNRRDAQIVKNRIQYIKQIIKSKKQNPDYVPDIHKKGDIEIDEKILKELKGPETSRRLKEIATMLDDSANSIKGNLVYKSTNSKDKIKEIEQSFELFKEKYGRNK